MAADPYVLEPLRPAAPPPVDELVAVVAAARAEADAIRDQARLDGLALGRAEAMEAAAAEAQERMRPAAEALAAAAAAVAAERAELAERVELRAVELAMELAEKVVAGALEVHPERVLDVIRGALRCLVERERIQVLVHPDDVALVHDAIDGVAAELGGIRHVDVQQERRVCRGGALVRTTTAEIDASIQTKLERARDVVAAELGGA